MCQMTVYGLLLVCTARLFDRPSTVRRTGFYLSICAEVSFLVFYTLAISVML